MMQTKKISSKGNIIPPRIISGGQTGVDRAALDCALKNGLPIGGWCPLGRKSEDGVIPDRYPLIECDSSDYRLRTELNVRDSDATLIIGIGEIKGGTAFTIEMTKKYSKPCLILSAKDNVIKDLISEFRTWFLFWNPRVLNIAGPRENDAKSVYPQAFSLLNRLFSIFSKEQTEILYPPWPPNNKVNSSDLSLDRLPKYNPHYVSWPSFEPDEIDAVVRVLQSGRVNYWTGEEGRKFEHEFAHFTGARYAVALANGSLALEAALFGLGIGPGDEVIVPCRSFIASASCVIMRGAIPIFADVDPVTQCLSAETIKKVISKKTRAIIVVHLGGWPAEMDPILNLAREYNLKVIEDCAQSLGAEYRGKMTGTLGDVGTFSFCQDKIMTTGGEGGMVITNNGEIWEKIWSYKDHGRDFETVFHKKHDTGFRWLCKSFGTNWRITEMQAAIGRIVLKKVPHWLELRRKNAHFLNEELAKIPGLKVHTPSSYINPAYYKYFAFVVPELLKPEWTREKILQEINNAGFPCSVGGCSEIYLEQAFQKLPRYRNLHLPNAHTIGKTSLMFQIHHTLPPIFFKELVKTLKKIMTNATR